MSKAFIWPIDWSAKLGPWSPFKRNGKLRITFYDDPWPKRLWARLRGEPLWHRVGAIREDDQ